MEDQAQQPNYDYDKNAKPKGKASVVPDDPIEIFPVDEGNVDKPE